MARTVVLTDDVDGSAGAATLTFGFEGASYELDLGPASREKMVKGLKPWIDAARHVSGRSARASSATPTRGPKKKVAPAVDNQAIRAWAAEHGLAVSERGRISASVLESYQAAH